MMRYYAYVRVAGLAAMQQSENGYGCSMPMSMSDNLAWAKREGARY